MSVRVWPVAVLMALSGCVSEEPKLDRVSSRDLLGKSGQVRPPSLQHAPAAEAVEKRVLAVGDKILTANPQIKKPIVFQTIGDAKAEVFHRVQGDSGQVFITQGLVNQCKNDGQLAAVLCQELGKIAAEQNVRRRLAQDSPPLPPLLPPQIGNDIPGPLGPADGSQELILARFEKDRQRASGPSLPLPSPEKMARLYLQNAGYNASDFDAAASLLRSADQNTNWQRQMTGKLGQ